MVLLDENILCIVGAAFWMTITIPVVLYCGYQLRVNWTEQYMIKRRRSIITTIYFVLSAMLITLPLIVEVPNLLSLTHSLTALDRYHETAHWIFWILDIPGRWACNLLFCSRVWLLYFDYHHSRSLASESWQILISPDSVENNWFLRKRATLGNPEYISKRIICPIVCVRTVLYIVIQFIIPMPSYIDLRFIEPVLFGVLSVATVVFMGCIWSKYPNFADTFFIRNELRIVFWTVSLGTICGSVILLMQRHFEVTPTMHICATQIAGCFVMWMMIVYPKRMLLQEQLVQYQASDGRIDTVDHWENKMSTRHGYEQFANYLSKQFAVEV